MEETMEQEMETAASDVLGATAERLATAAEML